VSQGLPAPVLPLPPAPGGRTLVLGAGGFLGSHAARWLAGTGARARLFDLSVESIPEPVRSAPGIEVVQGNLLDATVVRDALRGVDRVLHFVSATVPATSVDQVDLELRVNVEPTLRVLEAMRELGTPLIVFPSSGGTVYGDEAPATGFAEDAGTGPQGSYGLGKLLLEEICAFYARTGGPHCLLLRVSNAYGPSVHGHSRQGVIHAFLERLREGRPVTVWGDGTEVRDYVHVEDLISAVAALVQAGVRDQVFNLGSGRGVSVEEILQVIERVTGRAVEVERATGQYAGVRRSLLDVSRLRARVAWEPRIDLETGVRTMWESLKG